MHDKQDLSIYRLQNIQSGNLKMQLFDGAQDDDQVFFIHLFSFFFSYFAHKAERLYWIFLNQSFILKMA